MKLTLPAVIPLCNPHGRMGNATFGNVRRMSDESWRECEGTWDRLKWARKRRYATAKEAATALGVPGGTYRAYEREPGSSKWIKLDHEHAFHFAKRLGVRWEWLLQGDGEPTSQDDSGPKARAKRAVDQATDGQAEAIAEMIERLLRTGTNG